MADNLVKDAGRCEATEIKLRRDLKDNTVAR
jgi:hypothetical protein